MTLLAEVIESHDGTDGSSCAASLPACRLTASCWDQQGLLRCVGVTVELLDVAFESRAAHIHADTALSIH
jgi:hypothetical protein